MTRVLLRLSMLSGILAFTPNLYPQFGTGEISGLVTDQTGAAISQAAVKILNEANGQSKSLTTDDQGRYTALDLLVGNYTVEVSATGFRTYQRAGIALVSGSHLAVNVSLQLGAVNETVEVSGAGAQVETLSAQVGRVVEGRMLQDIPLNGRNITSIMLVKPGITSTNAANAFRPTSDARSYYINGSRAENTNLTLDGVSMLNGRNNLKGVSIVSVDAVAEANIVTSTYPAEYPRAGGGQVQFVTKSGTKQYHGTVYDYVRNDAFDARSFLTASKQKLRFNQYGFSLGGPVTIPKVFNKDRERLFFFANTEFITRRGQNIDLTFVPTPAERAGDFNGSRLYACPKDGPNGLPFPNCTLPAGLLSPNGRGLLNLYPLPNVTGQPSFNFRQVSPSLQDVRTSTFRVDYLLGRTRIFWRGLDTVDHGYGNRPTNFPSAPIDNETIGRSTALNVTSTLSATKLNSFRFGAAARTDTSLVQPFSGSFQDYSRAKLGINFPYLFGNDKELADKIPTVIVSGLTTVDGSPYPARSGMPNWQFQDDFSWIRGAHTIKFGAYFEYVGQNNLDQINVSTAPGSGNNQNGTFRFAASPGNTFSTRNALADMLIGRFDSYSEIGPKSYTLERIWSREFYIQDSWKVNSRLSVEFGLRYAYWTPAYALWGNFAMFYPKYYDPAKAVRVDPATGQVVAGSGDRYNGIALPGTGFPDVAKGRVRFAGNPAAAALFRGLPDSISTSDQNMFQPRFGLSWDPTGQGKMSVRLGGGVFNSRYYFNDSTLLGGNPPLQDQVVVTTGSVDNPGGTSVAPLFPLAVTMQDPHIRQSVTYDFSLTLQRQLPANFLMEAGYVGKLSRHLPSFVNMNQLAPGTLQANRGVNAEALRSYQGYSSILYEGNRAASNYNAMTFSLERRFHKGLTFQSAYTFSRSIDNASDKRDVAMISTNLRADRGLSAFDRPHLLSISYVYEVPFFRSDRLRLLRPALAGWQASGLAVFQSGLPTSVFINGDTAGVSGGGTQRANVIGNGTLSKSERTFNRYFNTAAFAAPAAGTFGNSGRNNLRRPGTRNWDMSISKRFRFTENKSFVLRGDFFNILNHLSYNSIQTTLGNAGFGTINGADPARVIQLALRFEF
ncbi:MAG: carboxypeptidase regulatory-like domain-containing protein [Bryobacterales bacterium]|nr:carboxypeptidase regulatory-like domain-containing protein [Bryobacterales bacterium]